MSSTTRWVIAAAVLASMGSVAVRGDLIELKDGRTFDGTMRRDGERVIITGADGKATTVAGNAIAKVTLQSVLSPEKLAAAEWTRMGPLVEKTGTLDAVIDLYKAFLAKFPDQPQATAAQRQLDYYQSLVGQNAVKYRGKWLTKDMIQDQEQAWKTEAAGALEKYSAGKLADARELAVQSIVADPSNPVTLAIAGLASFHLNELPRAKQFFTQLAAADPGGGLAWNNLGVIAFQQKAQAEALIDYTKAIEAKPDNRLVLDNAADAMGSYTGSKDIDAYRNLARQYAQAEAVMETVMARKGLYRLGNTWVTKEEKEKYGTGAQQIALAKAQLDAVYSLARRRLDLLNQQLATATADYNNARNTLASSVYIEPGSPYSGPGVVNPYSLTASTFDALARRQADLQQQVDQATLELQPMFAEAQRLQTAEAAIPTAPFTGVQRIMELQEVNDPPAPVPLTIRPAAGTTGAPAAGTGTQVNNAALVAPPASPAGASTHFPGPTGGGFGGGAGVTYGGGMTPTTVPPAPAAPTAAPTTPAPTPTSATTRPGAIPLDPLAPPGFDKGSTRPLPHMRSVDPSPEAG